MIPCSNEQIKQKVDQAAYLWLFLDYDGTLADFAPTPDEIFLDQELISLVTALAERPALRITIISGRRLGHIQALLPVPGLLKAGSYGLEMETADGELVHHVAFDTVRPLLAKLKQNWRELLNERRGFYLEDKGWTLAIHAKDAEPQEAAAVLGEAHRQAQALIDRDRESLFRLLGGHRFLECGPQTADKRRAVEHLLATYPWHEDALLVYLGDDDKDEAAFEAVQQRGGIAVGVGERMKNSTADCWLPSPQTARKWLQELLEMKDSRR
jgi:trehalose 6-phosphate phosphatase